VEEQVLALHNTKRLLAADILDDTGSSSLSSEILMDLLKGGQDTKTKKES